MRHTGICYICTLQLQCASSGKPIVQNVHERQIILRQCLRKDNKQQLIATLLNQSPLKLMLTCICMHHHINDDETADENYIEICRAHTCTHIQHDSCYCIALIALQLLRAMCMQQVQVSVYQPILATVWWHIGCLS